VLVLEADGSTKDANFVSFAGTVGRMDGLMSPDFFQCVGTY
jgi:hypothetical protein